MNLLVRSRAGSKLAIARNNLMSIRMNNCRANDLQEISISASDFEEYKAYKHAMLKTKIEEGLAQLEAGKVIDGKIVMKELRQLIIDA